MKKIKEQEERIKFLETDFQGEIPILDMKDILLNFHQEGFNYYVLLPFDAGISVMGTETVDAAESHIKILIEELKESEGGDDDDEDEEDYDEDDEDDYDDENADDDISDDKNSESYFCEECGEMHHFDDYENMIYVQDVNSELLHIYIELDAERRRLIALN